MFSHGAGALLVLASTGGCIVFPPTEVAVAAGRIDGAAQQTVGVVEVRAEVRPLGAFAEEADRWVDAGVGATVVHALDESVPEDLRWSMGPSASLDFYPARARSGEGTFVRLVAGSTGQIRFDQVGTPKAATLLGRMGFELSAWAEGCSASLSAPGIGLACGAGESGVGLALEAGVDVLVPAYRPRGAPDSIENDLRLGPRLQGFLVVRIPAGFAGGIPIP